MKSTILQFKKKQNKLLAFIRQLKLTGFVYFNFYFIHFPVVFILSFYIILVYFVILSLVEWLAVYFQAFFFLLNALMQFFCVLY